MARLAAGAEVSLVAWAAASPVGKVAGEGWLCLGAGDNVRAGALFGGGGDGWDDVSTPSTVVLSAEECWITWVWICLSGGGSSPSAVLPAEAVARTNMCPGLDNFRTTSVSLSDWTSQVGGPSLVGFVGSPRMTGAP